MISNQNKGPKDHFKTDLGGLPSWNYYSLKNLQYDLETSSSVVIDNYLVIIVHEVSDERYNSGSYETIETLLAADLRDNSVQSFEMPETWDHSFASYSFTKYKDNQIIKFGGSGYHRNLIDKVVLYTIESFQPFSVKYEEIKVGKKGNKLKRIEHTAQIYQDCLYVYGGKDKYYDEDPISSELWSFNLKTSTWKVCKPKRKGPGPREKASSLIIGDDLIIYGGKNKEEDDPRLKDFFILNMKNMTWSRLQQQEEYLNEGLFAYAQLKGDLYKDHLVVFGKTFDKKEEEEVLACWNTKTNSWSQFEIPQTQLYWSNGNLIVHKNLLIASGQKRNEENFSMAILNLESLSTQGLSEEQKHLKTLFMNQEQSDVQFKIEGKLIPAHKQVLIERSKYFANLFKSKMVESRQDVIEINDCEYPVFIEFLRFLYCKEVQFESEQAALKLLRFTDKYLQNDLNEKCKDFLTSNMNSDNVYTILDFARLENNSALTNWCLKFLTSNLTLQNVSGLIKYLSQQNNPEFAKDNTELKYTAIRFVSNQYEKLQKEDQTNFKFYEDFLIQSIGIDTIVFLTGFLYGPKYTEWHNASDFQPALVKIKDACFAFASQNFEQFAKDGIAKDLPQLFLSDLILYMIKTKREPKLSL